MSLISSSSYHQKTELELNHNLIQQIPKPFILLGDFKGHNEICWSSKTNGKGKIIELVIGKRHVFLYKDKTQTYLCLTTGTYLAIGLTAYDHTILMFGGELAITVGIENSLNSSWICYV